MTQEFMSDDRNPEDPTGSHYIHGTSPEEQERLSLLNELLNASSLRAMRPGGRIILEDDNHDLLRLWPRLPVIDDLWQAYIETWKVLRNDPFVGRQLTSHLTDAGAEHSAQEIADALVTATDEHCLGSDAELDDRTIVVIKAR